MDSLSRIDRNSQASAHLRRRVATSLLCVCLCSGLVVGLVFLSNNRVKATEPADPKQVKDADAKTEAEMKPYTEVLANSIAKFDMTPIPGGKFLMGSPETEKGHQTDEGPQHEVEISPFWMATCEVKWDAYDMWTFHMDTELRKLNNIARTEWTQQADAVIRPTAPYDKMDFGMGKKKTPAVGMTQHAARTFCKWLSAKTGRYYRLPTEAEWEYACRASTKTAYFFGDDPQQLDDYAWHDGNSGGKYHKVGEKKPNPWGIFDMYGNASEWTLDQYTPQGYQQFAGKSEKDPFVKPTTVYPIATRGGSWVSLNPEELRSAARLASDKSWKKKDPQAPQSIWYFTDASFAGFRVVRPLVEPTEQEKAEKWEAGIQDSGRYLDEHGTIQFP